MKARVCVDEAANEPGARDAVDLGPLARDPLRGFSGLWRYGLAACLPSPEPAFEIMNGVAPSRRNLATPWLSSPPSKQ